MSWPKLDIAPIKMSAADTHDIALWDALITLSVKAINQWTLVGGQMVYLHGKQNNRYPPRGNN